MMRAPMVGGSFRNREFLGCGLTTEMLFAGIEYVHRTLDIIDTKLIEVDSPRLSSLVELANLSTIIGNLLGTGIVKASDQIFERAGPHKYQDLRATSNNPDEHVEIKVALEKNGPKGHLPKSGHYLTCRYVLGDEQGAYPISPGAIYRGETAWIWELRFGYLEIRHFNVSNTEGDSGKTATISLEGMKQLKIVYFDELHCPYGPKSQYMKALKKVV